MKNVKIVGSKGWAKDSRRIVWRGTNIKKEKRIKKSKVEKEAKKIF